MPSRTVAPQNLLDAIFQNTNKLHWLQRQTILRFLAGEEAPAHQEPVVQILLHEERSQEVRQSSQRVIGNTLNSDGEVAQSEMKSYTIVDQIIFEMDYSNGCWRKLRRKIRIADKRNRNNTRTQNSQVRPFRTNRRQDVNGNVMRAGQSLMDELTSEPQEETFIDLLDVSTRSLQPPTQFITSNRNQSLSLLADAYASSERIMARPIRRAGGTSIVSEHPIRVIRYEDSETEEQHQIGVVRSLSMSSENSSSSVVSTQVANNIQSQNQFASASFC